MITYINKLVRSSSLKRFWGIVQDWCWVDINIILRKELDKISETNSQRTTTSLTWRRATFSDIEWMLQQKVYDITDDNRAYFESFIKSNNEYMLLGELNGEICTYSICATEKKRMYGRLFELNPDEAFAMICFTPDMYRGKGYGPQCLIEMSRLCKDEGKKYLFIDIATSNVPSLKSAYKAGFQNTDSGYYLISFCKRKFLKIFGSLKQRFVT
ncbi:MAG: GNAT family N-acetyltransferase [Thermoguttaceae bacterium]